MNDDMITKAQLRLEVKLLLIELLSQDKNILKTISDSIEDVVADIVQEKIDCGELVTQDDLEDALNSLSCEIRR
jgi:hypothetical protein